MKIRQHTIYDTPLVKTLARLFSLLLLRILGWNTEGQLPAQSRFVLIAAPHTSNWDLMFTMAIAFAMRTKVHWLGKRSLFRRPFGLIFSWFGGIPVDRSRSNNIVEQSIQYFHDNDSFILAVPPSGTRQKVAYWKTGFYYIALGARVPIVLGFLDYKRKVGGVGPPFQPTGDIESDMMFIREYYSKVTGRYPEKAHGLATRQRDTNLDRADRISRRENEVH